MVIILPCSVDFHILVNFDFLSSSFLFCFDFFISDKHFEGIVQLGLTIAIKRDPRGVALHYYKSGEPRDDLEGMDMFAYR